MTNVDLDQLSINTIRTLSMDAVQAANSGHPGTPMALAPVAYCLWQRFLRFDPERPDLAEPRSLRALDRPRLDAALLAAAPDGRQGGQSKVRDARASRRSRSTTSRRFRQLDSRCPGHPEYRWTSGVETTTGPLGQGVATSVGMAIAGALDGRALQPARLRDLFDFDVYALCGDGCMMEGICARSRVAGRAPASSRTCAGSTTTTASPSRATRARVHRRRRDALHRPTAGTSPASATPTTSPMLDTRVSNLPRDERPTDADHRRQPHRLRRADQAGHRSRARRAARRGRNPRDQALLRLARGRAVPRARRRARSTSPTGSARRGERCATRGWSASSATSASTRSSPRNSTGCSTASCPTAGTRDLPTFPADAKGRGRPRCSGKVLNAIAKNVPWLIGGSADLAPSTKTRLTFEGAGDFQAQQPGGRNIHFGVRETRDGRRS